MKKYSETKGGKNLLKAIEWHENKKGRKWFDIREFVTERTPECKTICCFCGWLSVIFPNGTSLCGFGAASKLFELDYDVCVGLFNFERNSYDYPYAQKNIHNSLNAMSYSCTPKALCKELRKFIKLADDGTLNMDGTQK